MHLSESITNTASQVEEAPLEGGYCKVERDHVQECEHEHPKHSCLDKRLRSRTMHDTVHEKPFFFNLQWVGRRVLHSTLGPGGLCTLLLHIAPFFEKHRIGLSK